MGVKAWSPKSSRGNGHTSASQQGTSQKDAERAKKRKSQGPGMSKASAKVTNYRDYTPSPEPSPEPSTLPSTSRAQTTIHLQRRKPPPRRTWSRQDFDSAADFFMARGRARKHAGDALYRAAHEASTGASPASSSSSSGPSPTSLATSQQQQRQLELATYQLTEAAILYVYAFWCQDQSALLQHGPHVISGGWASLNPLLRLCGSRHAKHGDHAIAGLCELIDGLVAKHMGRAGIKQATRKLSRLGESSITTEACSVTANTSPPEAGSDSPLAPQNKIGNGSFPTPPHVPLAAQPPPPLAPIANGSHSPSAAAAVSSTSSSTLPPPPKSAAAQSESTLSVTASAFNSLTTLLSRSIEQVDKGNRHITASRSTFLAQSVLSKQFPQTWQNCISAAKELCEDPLRTAMDLDTCRLVSPKQPVAAPEEDGELETDVVGDDWTTTSPSAPLVVAPEAGWSWPLEGDDVPFPHLVNFARCALWESGSSRKSGFQLLDLNKE